MKKNIYLSIVFFLAFTLIFSACKPEKTELYDTCGEDHSAETAETSTGDGHNHGSEKEQVTLYSENYELFMEYSYLIKGEAAEFLTHITYLGTQKPATDGKVTISIIQGTKGIRANSQPKGESIYPLELTPETAGVAKIIIDFEKEGAKESFIIEDAMIYANDEEAYHTTHNHKHQETEIKFTKEQVWKTNFEVTTIQTVPFAESIAASGEIRPVEGSQHTITAKTSGVIVFPQSSLTPGMFIKSGSLFCRISSGNMAEGNIQSKRESSRADYINSKSEFERAATLFASGAISEKRYQQAQTNWRKDSISFSSISKSYGNGAISVTAAQSGYLQKLFVTDGQFVESGDPIALITDNKRIVLKFDVSQKYYNILGHIAGAAFRVPYSDKTYYTKDLKGSLLSSGSQVNSDNYFIPVTYEIDNPGELIGGSFIEGDIYSNVVADAIAIKKAAILEELDNHFVYVQTGGESYEKRYVEIGNSNGDMIRITKGLKAGERVVTKGAYQVKMASMSDKLPEHTHQH